jgi:hypothetical protein
LNYPVEKLAIVSLNLNAIDLSLVRQNDLIKLDMFNNDSYTATVENSVIDSFCKQLTEQVEPLIFTADEAVIDLMVVYIPQATPKQLCEESEYA